MRLEIGGDRDLRQRQLLFLAQRGDDLGRQEMRVDDQIPRLLLQQADERRRLSFSTARPQPIALACRAARLVEHVVEIAEHVRRLVHQVQIGLAVDAAEGGVGQLQHVEVRDHRIGRQLAQGQFDGLGRAHWPAPTEADRTRMRGGRLMIMPPIREWDNRAVSIFTS